MKRFRHYFWTKGEPWNSVRSFILPQLLRVLHSILMCTLRVSTSGAARADSMLGKETGVLFVTWHDLTLMPLHLFRHKNIHVMMSTSHSGQIQASFFRMYGWPTIWGSTKKREGIKALRDMIRLMRAGESFAFTVDGPKGPRHQAYPGAIYVASKAPTVMLPLGVAASSAWRLPTWDRYLLPKPFSRVHVHIGEPMHLPAEIERDENPHWQMKVKEIIDGASEEAARQLQTRKTI